MTKAEAIWYLRHGASVKHISWPEKRCIWLTYGFITTNTNRVVSDAEFWRLYGHNFYWSGWELSDPFREMAVKTIDDETDELRIYQVMEYLREAACEQICGSSSIPGDCANERINLWHGAKDFVCLLNSAGIDYIPGLIYSSECVKDFINSLLERQLIPAPSYLQSVPYVREVPK